jgi:Tfp pilus assembly protein PilN
MRAVNLIPADERRNGSAGGRSGGVAYVLIGALAMLVVLAGAYGLIAKSVHDRAAKLADVTARAQAAEATAGDLAEFTKFAALRKERTQTIKTLAAGRVDWEQMLREIARTMPSNAWLTSLKGANAPASTGSTPPAAGAATPAPATPAATPAPSIELGGCTTSQRAVSGLMADLRRIAGVTDVRLASSVKAASEAGSAASSASRTGSDPCSGASRTVFSMTLSFEAPATGAAPTTPTTPGSPG